MYLVVLYINISAIFFSACFSLTSMKKFLSLGESFYILSLRTLFIGLFFVFRLNAHEPQYLCSIHLWSSVACITSSTHTSVFLQHSSQLSHTPVSLACCLATLQAVSANPAANLVLLQCAHTRTATLRAAGNATHLFACPETVCACTCVLIYTVLLTNVQRSTPFL